jgi:hypothetical protein
MMPGLLDNLQADDTTKDEFGQTQADRRQPIWSGLIKAGLLGVAAGGDLMPSERAKMVAQMGGAIGDIPGEMMQYRAGAAQQTLRGQQIATAKTKLDNIAKLQALAKTPEFLDSIKDLKPHEKIAMQAAIDAGDIDAFAKITGQVGMGAYKDQQLDIARQRQLTAEERLQLEKSKAEAKAGTTLQGTGLDQQMTARLEAATKKWRETGDTSVFATPEYQSAYDYVSKPKQGKGPNDENITIPGRDVTGLFPPPYHDQPYVKPDGPLVPKREVTVVPGGPKKALDQKDVAEIGTHLGSLQKFDDVNKALDAYPDVKMGNTVEGWVAGMTPEAGAALLNRYDPQGKEIRANIANIGSLIIKDRSGAAVSIHEMKRLAPFIPNPFTDNPAEVKAKLAELRKQINIETKLYHEKLKSGNQAIPTELAERARTIGKGGSTIPQRAIDRLIDNPGEASQFDEQFGQGAADRVLGR